LPAGEVLFLKKVFMETLQTPLNKAQLELLKIFGKIKTEEELNELKDVIVNYYAKRLMDRADKIWDERGYTSEDMDRIANQPS
jgi:DNA primase